MRLSIQKVLRGLLRFVLPVPPAPVTEERERREIFGVWVVKPPMHQLLLRDMWNLLSRVEEVYHRMILNEADGLAEEIRSVSTWVAEDLRERRVSHSGRIKHLDGALRRANVLHPAPDPGLPEVVEIFGGIRVKIPHTKSPQRPAWDLLMRALELQRRCLRTGGGDTFVRALQISGRYIATNISGGSIPTARQLNPLEVDIAEAAMFLEGIPKRSSAA